MDIAIIKDINKEYLAAVNYYEEKIRNSENVNPEHFINLAFLYFAFASEQLEFNIPNNITDEWSEIGGNRFSIIIDMGLEKFPNNAELHFWKLYYPSRLFMLDFSEKACKVVLEKYRDNESLAPYFFFQLFDKTKYRDKTSRLLQICIERPTAKNLYIKSFIEE